jgi:hypothetical protein
VLFMNREQDQMILKVIKNKFGKAWWKYKLWHDLYRNQFSLLQDISDDGFKPFG